VYDEIGRTPGLTAPAQNIVETVTEQKQVTAESPGGVEEFTFDALWSCNSRR